MVLNTTGAPPQVREHGTVGRHGQRLDASVPDLAGFMRSQSKSQTAGVCEDLVPAAHYLGADVAHGQGRKVFFETYGCQMNTNDTEIVWSILKSAGFDRTLDNAEADAILVMTCAIREGAEAKIWNRLDYFRSLKRGRRNVLRSASAFWVFGCMAERLKTKLLESDKMVDLVAGPDAYRDLPRLLSMVRQGHQAANVQLSLEETYADIAPVRLDSDSVSAFVSIMRGCDNMCSYCIVPFTRGRERSRPVGSILDEIRQLSDAGVHEVTLLGQNVNSYRDTAAPTTFYPPQHPTALAKGFKTIYRTKTGGARFVDLLDQASRINPNMRIRFTSPHPKDFPDELLDLIAERPNICKQLHLPAQSGNTAVLDRMRRGYTREAYLELVETVRSRIPGVKLSSDFIVGFCGETEQEHRDTVSLIEQVKYDQAFLFAYSMREKTHAHRRYADDVPEDVKKRRLEEVIAAYRHGAAENNARMLRTIQHVLVDGTGRRGGDHQLVGRTDGFVRAILPNEPVDGRPMQAGDWVAVEVTHTNAQTLRARPLHRATIEEFSVMYGSGSMATGHGQAQVAAVQGL